MSLRSVALFSLVLLTSVGALADVGSKDQKVPEAPLIVEEDKLLPPVSIKSLLRDVKDLRARSLGLEKRFDDLELALKTGDTEKIKSESVRLKLTVELFHMYTVGVDASVDRL